MPLTAMATGLLTHTRKVQAPTLTIMTVMEMELTTETKLKIHRAPAKEILEVFT